MKTPRLLITLKCFIFLLDCLPFSYCAIYYSVQASSMCVGTRAPLVGTIYHCHYTIVAANTFTVPRANSLQAGFPQPFARRHRILLMRPGSVRHFCTG